MLQPEDGRTGWDNDIFDCSHLALKNGNWSFALPNGNLNDVLTGGWNKILYYLQSRCLMETLELNATK